MPFWAVSHGDTDRIVQILTAADAEEQYDGLLWYRENEDGIACCNADSIRRVVNVECVGSAVRMVYGNVEKVLFENGTVTVTAEPGEITVLAVLDTVPLGLYSGAVLINSLKSGTFTVRGTGGKSTYAACYGKAGDAEELMALYSCEEGTEISVGNGVDKIKLLVWDGIEPVERWATGKNTAIQN